MNTWTDIDERVLRWLLDQDDKPEWAGRTENLMLRPKPEPDPSFEGTLTTEEVDDALRRLYGHGLIVGERTETVSYARWSMLRVTAHGLIVLGEWPDLDRIAEAQGLTRLLSAMAEKEENPEDKSALRQSAGAIARLGEGIVDSTIEAVGQELGGA